MSHPATLKEAMSVLVAEGPAARAQAGIVFVGVVGSLARGDAGPDSDIDVVFDATEGFSYWRLGGVLSELSSRLGRNVDLVDRAMMRPERWDYMARDFVALHDA